jgi:hypothetical protein
MAPGLIWDRASRGDLMNSKQRRKARRWRRRNLRRNFADPGYEPTDTDLQDLAYDAFRGVRQSQARGTLAPSKGLPESL